jgi:hypothetical protein
MFTVTPNGLWMCALCHQVTHVRGRFVCPTHGLNIEVGPQPDGVPKKHPCPGQDPLTNISPHPVWPTGLTCVQCHGWDTWMDPGPDPNPGQW